MRLRNYTYTGIERRNFCRLNIFGRINYYVIGRDHVRENTLSINISAGGVCIITSTSVKKGDILCIHGKLAVQNIPYTLQAKVIWKNEISLYLDPVTNYESGLEFVKIAPHIRVSIGEYVSANAPRA